VEVQTTDDGLVAVGHSKARELGAFVFTPDQWSAFVETVKNGRLD
jgi:hypothetical protein